MDNTLNAIIAISLLAIPCFVIGLIIAAIRKRPVKKWGIMLISVLGVCLVSLIASVVAYPTMDEETEKTTVRTSAGISEITASASTSETISTSFSNGDSITISKPTPSVLFTIPETSTSQNGTLSTSNGSISGEMIVSYIDVGQADCILIQQGNASMLIDAGNNADASLVVSFLKSKGITKLDYVIGTHPHEDHIGGLDAVIAAFEIGKIILPDASSTTATFEDVLNEIQAKGLKITKAVAGTSYNLNQASISILGPVLSSFADLNDSSVVCKVVFGSTSFLFEGDAETTSESAMISKGYDLRANVVKIGHHGSDSSTSAAFLQSVSPEYAVICVGANNQYGHPTSATLAALKAKGINVYRTDIAGTITAISTGSTITFSAVPNAGSPGATAPVVTTARVTAPVATTAGATAPVATTAGATAPVATTAKVTTAGTIAVTTAANPGNAQIVYITATGTKYHRDGCRYLSQSKIEMKLSDALARGLTPCSVCNP